MMGCKKCQGVSGFVFLLLGVLFLLRDFGIWGFWNIQWYSALFLWLGIAGLCMRTCKDCQAMCMPMAKRK